MNQVEFLGLGTLLRQCILGMFKTFCGQPTQKGTDTRMEIKKIAVVREVLCNDYRSRNLLKSFATAHDWKPLSNYVTYTSTYS